jgi:hypothetical protein
MQETWKIAEIYFSIRYLIEGCPINRNNFPVLQGKLEGVWMADLCSQVSSESPQAD